MLLMAADKLAGLAAFTCVRVLDRCRWGRSVPRGIARWSWHTGSNTVVQPTVEGQPMVTDSPTLRKSYELMVEWALM